MPQHAGWRRSPSRSPTPLRTGTPKANHSPSPISTTRASQQCNKAIHGHSMFCPKGKHISQTLFTRYHNLTGNDATQLEDWLLEVETTADLSDETRTKLAQAKLRGLTCTLIKEALTSGKSLEDIKDLLHLKICNSDIHTSVSHFMEIQQKENESLASYIYNLKGKPNNVASQIVQQQ